MPSVKYYRSVIPLDLLQIVGNYAGDENYRLVFTLSKKRRFLSNILMTWRDTTLYCAYNKPTTILKPNSWTPVRMNCIAEILQLVGERCKLPENIVVPSLQKITKILLEIHDYTLSRHRKWRF
jgi:hypothetical protein